MNELSGKTVIVAGAAGGIGEGVTRRLLEHGATVAALSRSEKNLERLQSYVSDVSTGTFVALRADLDQDEDGSRELRRTLHGRFGPADGAVVAIGNWGHANRSMLDVSDEAWSQSLKDNLTSHFRAMRILVPLVKPNGALVHLSGLSADGPYPGAGLIGLTNAAKKSLVLTMAAEREVDGPRIYELILGPIRTRERVARGVAMPRGYRPEDIGERIAELVRGGTAASRSALHYMIQRESE